MSRYYFTHLERSQRPEYLPQLEISKLDISHKIGNTRFGSCGTSIPNKYIGRSKKSLEQAAIASRVEKLELQHKSRKACYISNASNTSLIIDLKLIKGGVKYGKLN